MIIHNQKDLEAKCIILDGVKDHLVPHLSRKTIDRDMWEALNGLFQIKNKILKMVLREKLKDTKMTRLDMVTSYMNHI